MWWIVVPGAAVLAYKIYEVLKDRDEGDGPERLVAQDRGDLPELGPRLKRWSEVLRGHREDDKAPSETPAVEARARKAPRFRPSHLTLLTALLVVGATVLRRSVDAPWLIWTQPILLGALIGIGTNWLAIRMLFRPHRKVLGVIQGVIPANRERIAEQIARGVSSQLLDRETIRKAVHESDLVRKELDAWVLGLQRLARDESFRSDVEEILVGYVGKLVEDETFRARLLDAMARIARRAPERLGGVLGVFSQEIGRWLESMVHEHQDAILRGLESEVPAIVDQASERLVAWLENLPAKIEKRRGAIEQVITETLARRAASFDIEGLVRRRLEAFSTEDLERLILSATDEQLAWLQYLGWIIGAMAAPAVAGLEALVHAL